MYQQKKIFSLLKENKQHIHALLGITRQNPLTLRLLKEEREKEKDKRTRHYNTNTYRVGSNSDPRGEVSSSAKGRVREDSMEKEPF